MSKRSDWSLLLKAVENAGWSYRHGKHGIFVYPESSDARPITLAGTPSDVRSIRNARAKLKRAGLVGV
ncbi:hypothetical protein [Mycolicibacterium sp. CR10]|uniref:hypothetical protein n=1 Tax=Mycolicibacterium sp. CR10 TaxID=2562314 RepID=UPI0010C027F5|nr:hypothetical protein [Mycolicibacterium sp. CR10]